MRSFRHWTPRYVANRAATWVFAKRHPHSPWLTRDAIRLLEGMLLPGDVGIEWGSGRSTCWLARRLGHLTSVEHDLEWFSNVKAQLAGEQANGVEQRLCSLDGEDPTLSAYVRVAEEFDEASINFVLIDGVLREFCALSIIDKVAPGGVLVIDNANWFLDRRTYSPASRYNQGAANPMWEEVERRLRSWREIWTSNGVWDTALWIRPA